MKVKSESEVAQFHFLQHKPLLNNLIFQIIRRNIHKIKQSPNYKSVFKLLKNSGENVRKKKAVI